MLRTTDLGTIATENRAAAEERIDVFLVGIRRMRRLNSVFTGRARATDVLAFDYRTVATPEPTVGEPGPVAEIFVCPEMAFEAVRRYRTTLPCEVMRYIVHGLLHLAGFDDHDAEARRRMRQAERRALASAARIAPCRALLEVCPRRPARQNSQNGGLTSRP